MSSRQKIKFGLAARISSHVGLIGILMFSAVLGTNYFLSVRILQGYVDDLAAARAEAAVSAVEAALAPVVEATQSLAELASQDEFDNGQLRILLNHAVANTSQVHGLGLTLPPDPDIPGSGSIYAYYFNDGDGIVYEDFPNSPESGSADAMGRSTRGGNPGYWSALHKSPDATGLTVISYTVPIPHAGRGENPGFARADIDAGRLQQWAGNSSIEGGGHGYLLDARNIILAHPDSSYIARALPEILDEKGVTALWLPYLDADSADSPFGFEAPCEFRAGMCQHLVSPVDDTGWKFVMTVPGDDVNGALSELTIGIVFIAVNGLLALLAMLMISIRNLTRPLAALVDATRRLGQGDLEASLPVARRRDEIGLLASEFRAMQDSLRNHIRELTEATAREQRLESEIQIAQRIQMSMVPGNGKACIRQESYEIYASMQAARTVGGDLYFFHEESAKLHFLIGDVSGKGVPAALFMAKAVTLYQSLCQQHLKPGAIFSRMNDALCQHNEACMFVTAICGQLDIESGSLLVANAGHMLPLVVHGELVREMKDNADTALGIMEGVGYEDEELLLDEGTTLVMYTDGISEAFNRSRKMYGEERLLDTIVGNSHEHAQKLGESILDSVKNFVGDAEQSDDITILVLRYE